MLAVKVDEVAYPFESVTSFSVAVLFAKVPLAPELGAVKVTVTPWTPVPLLVTRTMRGIAKAVPTFAFCSEPLFTEILKSEVDMFSRPKEAFTAAPEAVAVT